MSKNFFKNIEFSSIYPINTDAGFSCFEIFFDLYLQWERKGRIHLKFDDEYMKNRYGINQDDLDGLSYTINLYAGKISHHNDLDGEFHFDLNI